ncbi:MAG: hypothetical protein AB2421_18995 [Thermotaleaceae bacterium]
MDSKPFVVVKVQKSGSSYNKLYYHQDRENALVVIFPGEDYSCDKPLLYYGRKAALKEKADVLCLSYKKRLSWRDTGQYTIDLQADASLDVISKCMEKKYTNIVFISKSIGTEVAGIVSERLGYDRIENIFLAPTIKAMKNIVNSKCTVILGTRDAMITQEQTNHLKQHNNVQLVLIEEADHYLESCANLEESLKILNQVVGIYMKTFTQSNQYNHPMNLE